MERRRFFLSAFAAALAPVAVAKTPEVVRRPGYKVLLKCSQQQAQTVLASLRAAGQVSGQLAAAAMAARNAPASARL